MNPISSASSGLLAASTRFNTAGAGVVAAANSGGGGDLAAAVVGQSEAGVQFQAAVNVQKVSDQMVSTLLDITV